MPTFKFFLGKENTVIVEKDKFSESIFHEQYGIAFKLLNNIITHPQKDVPNLIAFCGDRGEGKTSCMETVRNILLNHKNLDENQLEAIGAEKEKYGCLEVLDIIDPAFFDKEHNLIELLLGHLYGRFKKYRNNEGEEREMEYAQINAVSKKFQRVKQCLRHLSQTREDLYDPLEELDELSAGVELSGCISDLIREYLSFIVKKRLVISIDDIDLNMSRAYRMCEEVRKYLNNGLCIILISVKTEQLTEAVENAIHKDADFPAGMDISAMAAKYVSKLVPTSMRIEMPKAYDLCDYKLEVYGNDDKISVYQSRTVKEGVVRKIFNTSRFLFYNSRGAVSRIVPNNLRSLSHLLGLLLGMEEYTGENTDVLLKNKHIFKAYLYKTWGRQLSPDSQLFVRKLTEGQNGNDTHKYIASYLRRYLPDSDANAGVFREITDPSNYGYNVSVGDVLYLVSHLERSSFDEELQSVLFFIKAHYSITLYERYDDITDRKKDMMECIYPERDADGSLYRADALFEKTNILQRFVSGGYFTYQADEILPPKGRGINRQSRDFKIIRGGEKGLTGLFSSIKKLMPKYEGNILTEEEKKIFESKFKMAEFFALCTVQSIFEKEISSAAKVNRKQQMPYYLTPINKNTGFYIFDVLAPFTTLVNFKYAYKRFDALAEGFYDFALEHDWSLLREIISAVRAKNIREDNDMEEGHPDYNEDARYAIWRMYSNSIIRNSEVALAMMDNIKSRRYSYRDASTDRDHIKDLYAVIKKSGMVTYNRPESEKPYCIDFEFLEPIMELLKNDSIDKPDTIPAGVKGCTLPSFSDIYDFSKSKVNINVKAIITKKMIVEMFNETLDGYKEVTGSDVLLRISDKQNYLYKALSEAGWRALFSNDRTYKKSEVIEILKTVYNELIDAYLEQQPAPARPVNEKVK